MNKLSKYTDIGCGAAAVIASVWSMAVNVNGLVAAIGLSFYFFVLVALTWEVAARCIKKISRQSDRNEASEKNVLSWLVIPIICLTYCSLVIGATLHYENVEETEKQVAKQEQDRKDARMRDVRRWIVNGGNVRFVGRRAFATSVEISRIDLVIVDSLGKTTLRKMLTENVWKQRAKMIDTHCIDKSSAIGYTEYNSCVAYMSNMDHRKDTTYTNTRHTFDLMYDLTEFDSVYIAVVLADLKEKRMNLVEESGDDVTIYVNTKLPLASGCAGSEGTGLFIRVRQHKDGSFSNLPLATATNTITEVHPVGVKAQDVLREYLIRNWEIDEYSPMVHNLPSLNSAKQIERVRMNLRAYYSGGLLDDSALFYNYLRRKTQTEESICADPANSQSLPSISWLW